MVDATPSTLGNHRFPRTSTQQKAGNDTGEAKQSKWLGEGTWLRYNRPRQILVSNQGPR